MKRDQLDRDLSMALSSTAHGLYVAAARNKWPEALLALREAMNELDLIATQKLHQEVLLRLADKLVQAGLSYIDAEVRRGYDKSEPEAKAFIEALYEFKTARAVG